MANMQGTVSDRARRSAWTKPEKGFDDWTLQADLDAADRVLAALQRDLTDRVPPGERAARGTCADERDSSISQDADPWPSLGVCALRGLSSVGSAAFLVGLGLLIGSCFGDGRGLRDWGLITIIIGQAALLLASLIFRPWRHPARIPAPKIRH